MKYFLLPLLTAVSLVHADVDSSDGKPQVTFCTHGESCTMDEVSHQVEQTRSHLSQLTHSNDVVMKRFDLFVEQLQHAFYKEKSLTAHDVEKILGATSFAAEKHRLQTRKNKEKTPYISHPIGVTNHLMILGEVRDPTLIIAGLLHDTVEDTETSFDEIEKKFGKEVSALMHEISDHKSLTKEMRKRFEVATAAHKSSGAAMIKLADQLYNLKELAQNPPEGWSTARIDGYFHAAKTMIDRLPVSNDQKLKQEALAVIDAHWEKQAK